jgi:MtN3 and saliva related transmembrane protein
MMTETIGWVSSVILLLTVGKQIHKQWQTESSEGVSKWLFIGQVAASTGFTVYSWLVGNWVFVATNTLMLLSAFVGLGVVLKHRRSEKRRSPQPPRQAHQGARAV